MPVSAAIQVGAAAVSLLLGLCTIAYFAHRVLGRIEGAVRKVEGNTRELVNNGGSSIKDQLTPGLGGLVDQQRRTAAQVDLLVDALGTVRSRLETADDSLRGQISALAGDTAARLDQMGHGIIGARTALNLHIQVADRQTVAIGMALAKLGADVRLSTDPVVTADPAVGGRPEDLSGTVVIPVLPAP